eukprot:scaffold847_cov385-Prasinococcus_capsulatus_cf.AAC.9
MSAAPRTPRRSSTTSADATGGGERSPRSVLGSGRPSRWPALQPSGPPFRRLREGPCLRRRRLAAHRLVLGCLGHLRLERLAGAQQFLDKELREEVGAREEHEGVAQLRRQRLLCPALGVLCRAGAPGP